MDTYESATRVCPPRTIDHGGGSTNIPHAPFHKLKLPERDEKVGIRRADEGGAGRAAEGRRHPADQMWPELPGRELWSETTSTQVQDLRMVVHDVGQQVLLAAGGNAARRNL